MTNKDLNRYGKILNEVKRNRGMGKVTRGGGKGAKTEEVVVLPVC